MKRKALWLAAFLLAAGTTAYYTVPQTFKEPLLSLNRALSGLEEKTLPIDAHTIHYLEGGRGETVLLLHGIFAEKDHWVDFARPLTDRYHVVAPDLPGFGESGRRAGQHYDYATQTERLKQFMDSLGIARAHIAGNSMGGTIAALFAVRYPERVASLSFIGAPHGIRSQTPSSMDRLIDAGQAPLVARNPEEFEAMMGLVFADPPFLPYPIRLAAQQQAISHAESNGRLWKEQLKDRYLLQTQVGKVTVPSLALWGEKDKVFHVSGAQALKDLLPRAEMQVLPGLGHLPMMEAPKETARLYADFLARTAPGKQDK